MKRRTLALRLAGLTVAALAAAGCTSKSQVGSDVKVNLRDQVNQQRLGATTTTAAPPPASVVANKQVAVGGATTTSTTAAPRPVVTTTTTQRPVQYFDVAINGDSSGSGQFVPSASRVYTGTLIRFTNDDKVARSVVSDTGAFNSGPIAPGASWVYNATTAGTFNYHDGTRPYAVGTFQVIAR